MQDRGVRDCRARDRRTVGVLVLLAIVAAEVHDESQVGKLHRSAQSGLSGCGCMTLLLVRGAEALRESDTMAERSNEDILKECRSYPRV